MPSRTILKAPEPALFAFEAGASTVAITFTYLLKKEQEEE